MSQALLSAALLAALLAHEIERKAPWYWPTGALYGSHRVLQSYGQYQTIYDVNTVHQGLDIAASAGQPVRAPFAGTVLHVYYPAELSTGYEHYAMVILAAEGADWAMTVTHLQNISVAVGDEVAKGQELGEVVAWPLMPEFTHVHLGLFACDGCDPKASRTYVANPLEYLGGRRDTSSPFFRPIVADGATHYPVAFVGDVSGTSELEFYSADELPTERLDVLARVGDRFSAWPPFFLPGFWPPYVVFPFGPFFGAPFQAVAPVRLSVSITRIAPDVALVYQNTVDLTGQVSEHPYREPGGASTTFVSSGWPDVDLYFLLTNTELSDGAWDAGDPLTGGSGTYKVEITAEDASGNLGYRSMWATVK